MKRFSIKLLLFLFGFLLVSASAQAQYAIKFREAPVKDVVRMLAELNGKNVVVADGITGKVTASFQSIDLDNALRAVLETNGLGMVSKNKIIHISTDESLQASGEDLIIKTIPLKYSKVADVATQVESLVSERGSVMMDERTNSLSVRDTAVKIKDIQRLIWNIDKRDKQVLIEAKIVEASVEFIRSVGIQWGATRSSGKVQFGGVTGVGSGDAGRALNNNTPAVGFNGGSPLSGIALALGEFGGVITDVQLTAAEEKGNLNILSRPSVVTMNNQEARISSGIKFFIKTSGDVTIGGTGTGADTATGNSNLQEIEAGITLAVTPQITGDEKINLSIDVTESQADFSTQVDGVPSIIDNSASTTVLLRDGETTVIGGLFQIKKTKSRSGVPVLQRIPLFGALFRQSTRTKNKSELLIFIKPTIVDENVATLPRYPRDESTMKELTEKKDEKKKKKRRRRKRRK